MIALTINVTWQQLVIFGGTWLAYLVVEGFREGQSEAKRYHQLWRDELLRSSKQASEHSDRMMGKDEVIDAARRFIKWPSRGTQDNLARAVIEHDRKWLDVPEGEPLNIDPPDLPNNQERNSR